MTLENNIIYCINPKCDRRENPEDAITCQSCGTKLLVNDRYQLTKPLRELDGDYATDIFLVKDLDSDPENWGTIKVLKVLKHNNNNELVRLFKQESKTLISLNDPGIPIVELDGYFTFSITRPAQQLNCLIMEYIEGINLQEYLKENGAINEDTTIKWLTELVKIVHILHQRKLAHRDIKPSNIILRPNGQLTLIDFGTIREDNRGKTKVGTVGYAAPEQLSGAAILASDFHALGRTFVHLLTGTSPLNIKSNKNNNQLDWHSKIEHRISPKILALIDRLMAEEVSSRPRDTDELIECLNLIDPQKTYIKTSDKRMIRQTIAGLIALGSAFFVVFYTRPIAQSLNFITGNAIDRSFQNVGTDKFREKELRSAEFYFNAALFFNPENQASAYSLGRVCEIVKQDNCAMKKYRQVIQGTNNQATAAAISSLTRLQNIYKQPVDPSLIYKALAILDNQELPSSQDKKDNRIPASLQKNLGWWQLQTNQITEAEKSLKDSIALNGDRPAAYCLLAQVLEVKKQEATALEQWSECADRLTDNSTPEELIWGAIAQQRLITGKPNYKPKSIQPKDFKD